MQTWTISRKWLLYEIYLQIMRLDCKVNGGRPVKTHRPDSVCLRWQGGEKWRETMWKQREKSGVNHHVLVGADGDTVHTESCLWWWHPEGISADVTEARRRGRGQWGKNTVQTHKWISAYHITRIKKVRSLHCVPSGLIWTKFHADPATAFLKITLIAD